MGQSWQPERLLDATASASPSVRDDAAAQSKLLWPSGDGRVPPSPPTGLGDVMLWLNRPRR